MSSKCKKFTCCVLVWVLLWMGRFHTNISREATRCTKPKSPSRLSTCSFVAPSMVCNRDRRSYLALILSSPNDRWKEWGYWQQRIRIFGQLGMFGRLLCIWLACFTSSCVLLEHLPSVEWGTSLTHYTCISCISHRDSSLWCVWIMILSLFSWA